MSSSQAGVHVEETSRGVAVLTIDNPPLNLVTREVTEGLHEALDDLSRDRSHRVLILIGAGNRAFCAGSDVREFPDVQDAVVEKKLRRENEVMHRLEELHTPVIAAIEGAALGAGCELALACDLRIMTETARIGQPEVKLGAIPGSGGLFRLPRIVGEGRALQMLLLGEPIGAEEAHRIGLANQVVPEGTARKHALAWAENLSHGPQVAIRAMKRGFYRSLYHTSREAAELIHPLSQQVFDSADLDEGVSAFLEKRSPRFQ